MENLVIIHGKPPKERYDNPDLPKPHKANWLPLVGSRIEADGIPVAIPPMPAPYFPVYDVWKPVFDAQPTTERTGFVGHSAGADFLLRVFSEDKSRFAVVLALAAPYRDIAGKYGDFSKYDLDRDLPERVGKLIIFNSLNDTKAIQDNAHRLAAALPGSELIELPDYGHFMTPDFPELYEALINS